MTHFCRIVLMTALLLFWLPLEMSAGCNQIMPGRALTSAEHIKIVDTYGAIPSNILDAALSQWNQSCPGKKPMLSRTRGEIVITIEQFSFPNEQGLLGFFRGEPPTGQLTGGTIELWIRTNRSYPPRALSDQERINVLVHELGHVFGLEEGGPSDECNSVTANTIYDGSTDSFIHGSVSAADCEQIERVWEAPTEEGGNEEEPGGEEPEPIDEFGCFDEGGQYIEGGFIVTTWCCGGELLGVICVDPEPTFKWKPARYIISGYLAFDLTQYGQSSPGPDYRSRKGDTVLLGIDFDLNGVLDNRLELLQGPRSVPHAGQVLAELDSMALGGNSDGILDKRDFAWEQLVIRFADDPETFPLESVDIDHIDLVPFQTGNRGSRNLSYRTYSRDGTPAFLIHTIRWNQMLE